MSASREVIGSERRAASGIEAETAKWASGDSERNRRLVDERDRLRAALEATKQLHSQRSEGYRIMSGPAGKRPSPTAQNLGGLIAVGSHIDATCGKCKSVTSHIILAKIGSKPTRVECRVCGAMHAYKSPNAPAAGRGSSAKAAKPAKAEDNWSNSIRRAQGDAVPYSKSGSYAVGSRVTHPSFGEGVVTRLSSPTVCEVLFSTGTIKLLMRPGERPA